MAADGINAAYRNSRRLFDDAAAMFAAQRYPTAMSLAVLSIEEYGKASIIHRILLAKSDKTRIEHWREFTSHTAKNTSWVVLNLIKSGATSVDDFRILADPKSPHPFVLDDFKQWGFYTECRGNKWTEPEKTITHDMTFEVLTYAGALLRTARDVTSQQMECYVRHLFAVCTDNPEDADQNAVRRALVDYAVECQQNGWMSQETDPAEFFKVATVNDSTK